MIAGSLDYGIVTLFPFLFEDYSCFESYMHLNYSFNTLSLEISIHFLLAKFVKIFVPNMNTLIEKKEETPTIELGEVRNMTITLSGTDRKVINKFSREFYEFVLKFDPSVKEPMILPTAEAVFTTRKSPCGNGTATFSKHTLRVFQRVFDISIHDKNVTTVTEFLKNSTVDAQLKLNL